MKEREGKRRYLGDRETFVVEVPEDVLKGIEVELVALQLGAQLFHPCRFLLLLPCWNIHQCQSLQMVIFL